MNLGSLFEFAVSRYPLSTAIVEEDNRYSYHEMDQITNRLAYGLQHLGVEKGDRVVTLTKNRKEMVVLYWAVQKIGAVFTPINFRLSADEVRYCVQNAEAKMVVYEQVSEEAVMKATEQDKPLLMSIHNDPKADAVYEKLISQKNENFNQPVISENDYCLMLYTSGTTGKPKGVPRTHKNEYGAAIAHIIQNKYEQKESTLGIMPLYHTMGMRSLLSMALLNGKLAMIPDFDPKKVLETVETEKISCVYLVPTIIHDVLHHPKYDEYDMTSLRKLGYAGAAMTQALTEECFKKLSPDVFVNHYGSTEVYTFSICDYLDKKPGCAGKAGFHQKLRVVIPDPDGNAGPNDTVEKGEPGEIIVDTRSIEAFQGYWKREDATKKSLRDGWYFTGDMGIVDPDGDLYVVGRVDDMIISGGENIHPLEVEDVLAAHPQVSEAAVVGLQDDRWGEKVTAFVVAKTSSVTAETLDTYCKENPALSNFKRPRDYVFLSEIPKSAVGKVLRTKLKNGEYKKVEDSEEGVM
ncbi:class I adenylate-forming enzyme family protein [Alteribacillus sp. YIM 98480]|uniref:class I adenylate-forming enzyme family protein n=1 Tax=Alteribacillus sp. YIM 98480 TaxID=2606599 RepID=UPI00131CA59C|nr:AMP-binding protein [Alteribacillus sp. YIM 98480]